LPGSPLCNAGIGEVKSKTNNTGLETEITVQVLNKFVVAVIIEWKRIRISNKEVFRCMFQVLPFNKYTRDLEQRFIKSKHIDIFEININSK